jgi:chromosome segregation ATPase
VDKLKQENLALEKQLTQLKAENSDVLETSAQLQSQLEELETAAESYKRQTERLTNENDALIQQMESLEMEMKRKEDEMSRKQFVIFNVTLLICMEKENYGTVCVSVCSKQ